MSQTISILTIVDTVDIANNGITPQNTYMIDTQGYLGESEGTNELITKCNDGDILQWRIVGIRPNVTVNTANYSGSAKDQYHIIDPEPVSALGEDYWTSRVELGGNQPTQYQYTFDIVINDKSYPFDPYILVSKV